MRLARYFVIIGELIGTKSEMQQLEDHFLDGKYTPFVDEASQPCPKRLRKLILFLFDWLHEILFRHFFRY